jgi:dTMP kinase
MKGLFVTFEGCEGSGKSTHSEKIYQSLIKQGYPVLLTHEPGGTKISDKIRELLLTKQDTIGVNNIVPNAELMLYLASRAQHVEELIMPSLKANKIVLCDRFADATVAYQGYGRKLDLKMLRAFNTFVSHGLVPHHTVLLDIEPRVGIERSKRIKKAFASEGELDRMESQSLRFHNAVRKGYQEIARHNPDRFAIYNTSQRVEATFKDILNHLLKLIENQCDIPKSSGKSGSKSP